MLRNYFKIAFRNLLKHKVYSLINISSLAAGMTVTMLIGLWIYDELSFDKYHKNYDQIAQVGFTNNMNGEVNTWPYLPVALAQELRTNYAGDFKYAVMSSFNRAHVLAYGDTKFIKSGFFIEPEATEMFTLKMLKGNREGLKEPASILLSESVAKAYFGSEDPINKIMKLDNEHDVKITGVYEDLPANSTFAEVSFLVPWALQPWLKDEQNNWNGNSSQVFVQLANNATITSASARIKPILLNKISKAETQSNPELLLVPMKKWHLHQTFKNGVIAGGNAENVWLFGIIGVFVLLLACINFMNLSTARSEKRAKEVGIRKAVGSLRRQLIAQFFGESLFVVVFAFAFSLLLIQLILPFFNEIANKEVSVLWTNPLFWFIGIGFCLLTAFVAGSYPALYLSSFQPVKVLKGTMRAGRFATIPRKALVVVQFTVSITLIIGTIVVFHQVQFAQDRQIGYNREGLLMVEMISQDIHQHFDVVKDELIKSGAVTEMAESEMPATKVLWTGQNFDWKGKDPNLSVNFPVPGVSYGYGKTVGWQFMEGRDFSKLFPSDSSALILNETAAKFMNLKNPIGQIIRWDKKEFTVIGVIKDMIMESPYVSARPSVFFINPNYASVANLKLNPAVNPKEALSKIETVFKKYNPTEPFNYKFVDEEFDKKFATEVRIGTLATFFAVLAILISCLGLFGLATFTAEQRTKEIGIRKVLGASVLNLWQMLSKDFVLLVIISCLIAIPMANYFLNNWLQKYEYHTEISWWIFAVSGIGALSITLLTVSYQTIKAALMNPVKSLKSE